jgi:hypothetical protein
LREEEVLEYVAYGLLVLVIIGSLLYVTMSPEVEHPKRAATPRGMA